MRRKLEMWFKTWACWGFWELFSGFKLKVGLKNLKTDVWYLCSPITVFIKIGEYNLLQYSCSFRCTDSHCSYMCGVCMSKHRYVDVHTHGQIWICCCLSFANELITLFSWSQHYLKDADGLCTQLTRPVTKQGGSFGTVSLDEFKNGGWVINKPDVQVGEIIGKGAFGGKKNADVLWPCLSWYSIC